MDLSLKNKLYPDVSCLSDAFRNAAATLKCHIYMRTRGKRRVCLAPDFHCPRWRWAEKKKKKGGGWGNRSGLFPGRAAAQTILGVFSGPLSLFSPEVRNQILFAPTFQENRTCSLSGGQWAEPPKGSKCGSGGEGGGDGWNCGELMRKRRRW